MLSNINSLLSLLLLLFPPNQIIIPSHLTLPDLTVVSSSVPVSCGEEKRLTSVEFSSINSVAYSTDAMREEIVSREICGSAA
jgi:hypothetical protein